MARGSLTITGLRHLFPVPSAMWCSTSCYGLNKTKMMLQMMGNKAKELPGLKGE